MFISFFFPGFLCFPSLCATYRISNLHNGLLAVKARAIHITEVAHDIKSVPN
jgi:hypothetical protein